MARAKLQQDRSRATRLAIILAAEELWSSDGFDGGSVDDVCRKAGVAKGTFYFYFPRKEHLLVMLVFGRILPRESDLKRWLESKRTTLALCIELVSGIASRARGLKPRLVLRAVEESFSHHGEIGKLAGGGRSIRFYAEPILERGVTRGEVNDAWRSDILAGTLGWSILQELYLWGAGRTEDAALEPNLRHRTELITNGATTDCTIKPAPTRSRPPPVLGFPPAT
jgi:AcrR family transcriptional regulator